MKAKIGNTKNLVEKQVEPKKQPIIKFRSGALECAIWQNESENSDGEKFENYSFTIQRTYLDDKATKTEGRNVYGHTNSMRKRDVVSVLAVMHKVLEYLYIDEDEETLV